MRLVFLENSFSHPSKGHVFLFEDQNLLSISTTYSDKIKSPYEVYLPIKLLTILMVDGLEKLDTLSTFYSTAV